MIRFTTPAAACCAIAAVVSISTAHATHDPEELKPLFPDRTGPELEYLAAHRCVVDKLGAATAGRNYVISGYNAQAGAREATAGELAEGTARLDNACHPPAAPASVQEPAYSGTPTDYSGTASSTVMCESGGDYSINTGNGYYGGYQFDSSTWDAYGDPAYGEANEAPPAVQDAAAASVPYDAWPNC